MVLEQSMTGTVIGEMLGLPDGAAASRSASSTCSPSATASFAVSRSGSTLGPSSPAHCRLSRPRGTDAALEERGRIRIATPISRR
jgi:hypothetical protein